MSEPTTHPVQLPCRCHEGKAPTCVTMLAYEVYAHVHGPQEALVTGHCRGGFGVEELIAFLYARSFSKSEWRTRVDEAFNGLRLRR